MKPNKYKISDLNYKLQGYLVHQNDQIRPSPGQTERGVSVRSARSADERVSRQADHHVWAASVDHLVAAVAFNVYQAVHGAS